MTKDNKPNRASQTKKSDSTKVETRAAEVKPVEQKRVWTPPSYLDTPNAPNGFRHRWVRTEILGFVDTKNIQGRLRSGYELVRADEYPEEDFPTSCRRQIRRGDRARRPCADKGTRGDRAAEN